MKQDIRYSKAFWLLRHTGLTFRQIADFCQIDVLEVHAIENMEHSPYKIGYDLVYYQELTREEIARCEQDTEAVLIGLKPQEKKKKTRIKK